MITDQKFLQDLKVIVAMLDVGVPLLPTLKSISDGKDHWHEMYRLIGNGSSFYKAISCTKTPIKGLTDRETRAFMYMVKAGELGGVLEVTLKRYLQECVKGYTNKNRWTLFFRTFGMFLASGVPVLEAISNLPDDSPNQKSLRLNLYEGENIGSLPEVLYRVADLLEDLNTV